MTIYMETAPRAAQDLPMTDAERKARVQLAACYRIFDMLGWVEMIFNHITVRVPGPEVRFLINPFGLHYREITASNLVLIDIDGNPLRPTEWPVNRAGFVIHSAIHGAVANAHCVMHTHTTTGMAVACLKDGLSPHNFYGAHAARSRRVPRLRGHHGGRGRARAAWCATSATSRAVILRNHGLLAWGPSVAEAFLMLWTLQRACDVQIAASAAGAIHPIRPEVFEQTVRESGPAEKRTCDDVFAALQRQVDARDPSYRN